jgi:hypothetical protein
MMSEPITNQQRSGNVFQYQFDLLRQELGLLDLAIRQYDEVTKSIKNWAILTWTASMGLAASSPQFIRLVGLAALVPLLFWVVDGSYRRIQRTFVVRLSDVARFINSEQFIHSAQTQSPIEFPLMLMRTRDTGWKATLLRIMLFRTVGILYLGLSAVSLLVWLTAR